MPTTRRAAATSAAHTFAMLPRGYATQSRRPLQILAFLLPLIVAFELSLVLVLRAGHTIQTVEAHRKLLQFFDAFGLGAGGGLFLGGLAIVVVLFLWHLLNRDPWKVDVRVLGLMALEAAILTIPLLLLAQLLARSGLMAESARLNELGATGRIAISVGAGLYEELLFRMLLIAFVHALLVDVGRASQRLGVTVAIIVSATAFTFYHPLRDAAGSIQMQRLIFFFLAGLYFGAIYAFRGFGIVVGVHALYDIVTTLFLIDPHPA